MSSRDGAGRTTFLLKRIDFFTNIIDETRPVQPGSIRVSNKQNAMLTSTGGIESKFIRRWLFPDSTYPRQANYELITSASMHPCGE